MFQRRRQLPDDLAAYISYLYLDATITLKHCQHARPRDGLRHTSGQKHSTGPALRSVAKILSFQGAGHAPVNRQSLKAEQAALMLLIRFAAEG
ncbi:hypothetical protein BaRGS_00039792 [Batillaria attramentaria]|uniref:Uncharacterized protein n=1 Tax=Batillaria attramentaria TaxID=370345 RepID=A0ABD0J245_9CAEN